MSAAVSGRLTLALGVSHPAIVEAIGYRYDRPAAFTAIGRIEAPAAAPPSVVLAAMGPRMLRIAGSRTDGTVTSWVGPRTLGDHVAPPAPRNSLPGSAPRLCKKLVNNLSARARHRAATPPGALD